MDRDKRPRIAVRPSPIHGHGVFALQAISRGTVILRLDDSRVVDSKHPLRPEYGEDAIHLDYLPDGSIVLMQSPERFINHSCEPNSYVYSVDRERFLLAMRDVPSGEEILADYSINAVDGDVWECRCGAPTCRGGHKCDFFTLPAELQRERMPYLDPWFAGIHRSRIRRLLATSL